MKPKTKIDKKKKVSKRKGTAEEPVVLDDLDSSDNDLIIIDEKVDPRILAKQEEEEVQLMECTICEKWLSRNDLYSLDMCSHLFCIPCLKSSIQSKKGDSTCPTCKGVITDNDFTFILSPSEYAKWQETCLKRLMHLRQSIKSKGAFRCQQCSHSLSYPKSRFFRELDNSSTRSILAELTTQSFEESLQKIDSKLFVKCSTCKQEVCVACQSPVPFTEGHIQTNCSILRSVQMAEVLRCLCETFQPGTQKRTKSSKGSGKLKGVAMAHHKEDLFRSKVATILKIFSRMLPSESNYHPHSSLFPLIRDSQLLEILRGYFRNDWLMDSSDQQTELYFALLEVVRNLSAHPSLVGILLIPQKDDQSGSIQPETTLLDYIQTLDKQAGFFLKQAKTFSEQEESKMTNLLGLALDIQNIATQVRESTTIWSSSRLNPYYIPPPIQEEPEEKKKKSRKKKPRSKERSKKIAKTISRQSPSSQLTLSQDEMLEKRYISVLKPKQFEFMETFPPSQHCCPYLAPFISTLEKPVLDPSVILRISQELSSLANSLPLSLNSGIFMRVDEQRVNVVRFLILHSQSALARLNP